MTPLLLQEQDAVRQEIMSLSQDDALSMAVETQVELTELGDENPMNLFGGLKTRLGFRLSELCIHLSEKSELTETEWLTRIQADATQQIEDFQRYVTSV